MSSATRVVCGLVLASLVATAMAAAQGTSAQFGVGASLTIPNGDFHADANGDGFNAGWQGIALVEVRWRGSPVGFRVGGTADVTYHFKGSSGGVAGYLVGGVGVYSVKLAVTSGGATADSSETKFAWNVGMGLTYAVGGAALFFEARYVDVAKSFGAAKTPFIPITAGVRFGGK